MLRNWLLQDLPHVLAQRSLQTLGAASFHTVPTRSRKFWNLFEFSRKNNNRKDVKKLSKQDESSKKNKLNESSKYVFSMKNSDKIYLTEQTSNDYTFRYIPRMKPRSKASRSNINKPDELTSLLDGNLVPTNMKLKLKGYKTLRNAQAKDFAFVPGGKCFELDILPNQNEDGSIGVSYKLSETVTPKKVEKLKKLPPRETSYNELETNYVPFPIPLSDYSTYTETKDSKKIVTKETSQSQSNPVKNTLKPSETRATMENDTQLKQKEALTPSRGEDQLQVRLGSDNNTKVQQSSESLSQKNVQPSSPETEPPVKVSTSQNQEPSRNLSNQNQVKPPPLASPNQPDVQHNLSKSRDTAKTSQLTSSNAVPNQSSFFKTSHNQSLDPNVKKIDENNPSEAKESEKKLKSKIPRYSMYESRMELQRRDSSPCSTSFVRARENSTKQRWSGFDRPATGCCPGSSGSHGTGSQGSTRPYPSTVPTREASSKCYVRERDPIVRSDIAKSSKMVKTRNPVTTASTASIATVNFAEASTWVKGERILLGSKSVTGLAKISQTVAYGSCNKSNSNCNDNNSCCKKRRNDCEDEQMIPGKVICTKPRKRNDCCRPKPCRVERKFTCAEKPPPPRPSCCKPKKKKKVCKRYCCPALQTDDCLLQRHTCPPKRGKKCSNNNEDDDDFDRPDNEDYYQRVAAQKDPTCLPMDDNMKHGRNDCSNNNDNDNCGTPREICTTPRRCNKSRNCNREERDDDCLETDTEYREICTKPKKKDCCNSRRGSRRSNSCGHRRYHSETRPLRSSKSFVTIPIFDVSVVSLRPYQNDAVLRFYSCRSGRKTPSSCGQKEDPCKKKCQKPEPKCLNKTKSASVCGEIKEDNCTRINQRSMYGAQMEDPCGKKKVDPCAKKRESVCGKPKSDPCGSSRDTKEADRARLQKELQEMRACKGIDKKCKTGKKKYTLERVVSPCKQNKTKTKDKCDKFESIDDSNIFDVDLPASQMKLDDRLIDFWVKRECDSSLLNFGMKPDNIVNRSFCTTRKTDRRYENALQHGDNVELPALVEADSPDTESSSSLEW